MAQKLLKPKKAKIAPKKDAVKETSIVLVGTYKEKQLAWIKKNGVCNYPVKDGDGFDEASFKKIKELWLYASAKGTRHAFAAEFVGKMSREDFIAAHPTYAELPRGRARTPSAPQSQYYIFKTTPLDYGPMSDGSLVVVRAVDFETGRGRAKLVKKAVEQYKADGEFAPLANYLPSDLAKVPRQQLRVCDSGVRYAVWSPVKGITFQQEKIESIVMSIGAFARHRDISAAQAYRLLRRNGVLRHLDEHYEIECCLPLEHIVADMEGMCAGLRESVR